ncbi:hypothetical protein BH09MYX1_BH09MYX1_05760 [soil metagenome]
MHNCTGSARLLASTHALLGAVLMAGGAACSDSSDGPVEPIDAAVESSVVDAAVTPEASADASGLIDADADAGKKLGSIGCGKVATSGPVASMIKVGTLDRSYILSIPVGYDREKPIPLVFGWHGQSGTAAHFRAGDTPYGGKGGAVETASDGKAIFVYPLGTNREGAKTGWQIGEGIDTALFDALVAKVSGDLCVDPARIFSFGFSYGARMSNQLACLRPNVLRGVAPVSGYGPIVPCAAGPVGVWMLNIQDDPVVPFYHSAPENFSGEDTRDFWIKQNGCTTTTTAVTPAGCVAYTGCKADAPLTFCAQATGGHAFPPVVYDGIWKFIESF